MAQENQAREITPFTMFGHGKPRQQGNVKDFTPVEEYDRPNFPAPTAPPAPEDVHTDTEQGGDDSPPDTAPESTAGDGGEEETTDDELAWLEEDAPDI